MENSIEENIKILENWLEELNELFKNTHINNTKERKALEHILSDYKRLQEEFKQVDHQDERLEESKEILNKMKNKYKLALFMVIRNSLVMTRGIIKGKTMKEINKMSYETMCSVLTMIDYDQAEKFYEEGKSERK